MSGGMTILNLQLLLEFVARITSKRSQDEVADALNDATRDSAHLAAATTVSKGVVR